MTTSIFQNRKNNYVKSDDPNISREERMTRLKFELREHIRFLSDYDVMTTDWLRMAESLHQIANVAFMETHLPASDDNPLSQKGKKETGTLWDQERDELAVRILLEEGKLNLALRILHKYKTATRGGNKFEDLVKSTCKKFNSDIVSVTDRCRVFEQSVGVLLRYALQHVEALQILDVPELLGHVKEVLTESLSSEKKENLGADSEKMQETLIIHYLQSLSAKMEDMDEDRVMELIESNNIIPLLVDHLHKHYNWYKIETLNAACKFFANAMSSEAYTTEKDKFITSKEVQQKLVDLKGYFVSELVSTYGLKKKEVQSLLDQLVKFELIHGEAKVVPLKSKGVEEKKDDKKPEEKKDESVKKDKDEKKEEEKKTGSIERNCL